MFIVVAFLVFLFGCKKDETPPTDNNTGAKFKLTDFESATSCSTCHPQYYEEWKGSMHRYSTSDPIWMLANNSLQQSTNGVLKSTCFQCHSPIGFLTGNAPPNFQFNDLKDIVREGINCDVCHRMVPPHTTTSGRIAYNLKKGNVKYGQLVDAVDAGAHENGYDASFERSEMCRECHDLISNGVPVEVTFKEWQNSPWGAMSVECQDCHMQTYTGRAATGGPIRENLHRHDMVGVDVAISDFPYRAEQRAQIDSLLKNSATLTVVSPSSANVTDSILVAVNVYNDKTGHNLPTSVFFNRQMWIEVNIWNATDTVYRSGNLDANGDLMDKSSALSPNADKDLKLFAGTLYKNGHESNVFEMDSLVNNSIPPFASRTANYKFKVPSSGTWNVSVRLLFRPFGPYLFRALNAHQYLTELPIFEMEKEQSVIIVQ